MTKTLVLLAAVLAFTAGASAQTAAVSPQKQQLVDQILQAQQAGIDQLARQLVEQPAVQLLQRAAALVRRNVAADQLRYATSRPNVFAAGDMRRGQSLVVWAIREGRQAAHAIDRHLMGETDLPR